MSDSCSRMAMEIFNFPLFVLSANAIDSGCLLMHPDRVQAQNFFHICLLQFVATLRHDNNCCSRHQ